MTRRCGCGCEGRGLGTRRALTVFGRCLSSHRPRMAADGVLAFFSLLGTNPPTEDSNAKTEYHVPFTGKPTTMTRFKASLEPGANHVDIVGPNDVKKKTPHSRFVYWFYCLQLSVRKLRVSRSSLLDPSSHAHLDFPVRGPVGWLSNLPQWVPAVKLSSRSISVRNVFVHLSPQLR